MASLRSEANDALRPQTVAEPVEEVVETFAIITSGLAFVLFKSGLNWGQGVRPHGAEDGNINAETRIKGL